MRGTCSTCQARYRLPSTVHHSRVAFLSTGGFRLLKGTVVTLEAETNTRVRVRVRVCVGEREKVCRPQQSAVAAACPPSFFFPRQASAPLAALQDSVFSAVQFQRKAAKQNGTGLSQILSCRWTDQRKHAGTASLWCLYTCSIYRRAGNLQRGGRNRQSCFQTYYSE